MNENFDFELAKLLREQVPYDESLHSTLLRGLFAYDPNIKPIGVIGKSGLWIDFPFVQQGYEYLFYRYPDHALLEKIDMGLSVNGEHNGLFDNPSYYNYRIESTFFSRRRLRGKVKSSKRVRYCLFCIKEGINSVGYGYFRHFWDNSNVCLIHGQPLKELPALGFTKTLKSVKRLFSGKDCKEAIILSKDNKFIGKSYQELQLDTTSRYIFPIKFASGCLMPVFSKWIYNHYSTFKDITLRDFAQKVTSQYFVHYYENGDTHKLYFRRDLAIILTLCAEYEPELLHLFMVNEVGLIGLELGPRKQGVLREIFAKHSESDCSTCAEKYCIMKTHQGTFSVDATELNLQNLFENSYTLKRICMQDRPISMSGGSIWGPIDVYPEVTGQKAPKYLEIRLNEASRLP